MVPIPTDERVKLVNGRFVDVVHGCYYDSRVSLILHKGKIVAMPGLGETPDESPVDAVIDLQGKTVIPGLFNTHCHLQFIMEKGEEREQQIAKNLSDCLQRGITNIRDTLCFILPLNQAWNERIKRGEIPGPRIHQAIHVSPLGGTYAPEFTLKNHFLFSLLGINLVKYNQKESGVVVFRQNAGEQEVRDAVERAIDERGAAAIKLCDQPEHFMTYQPGATLISAGQLEAAVDQATRRGLPTTIHNVTVAGFRQAVKVGVTSLAHLPLDGELVEEDAKNLLASHCYIEPTLTVAYSMSYSMAGSPWIDDPEIQRLNRFRDLSYTALMEEAWLPATQKNHKAQHQVLLTGKMKIFGVVDISAPFRYMSGYIPIGGKNLRFLAEKGLGERFGCGNDAGASNCSPAGIHLEISMFDFTLNQHEKGLFTAADALRLATIQSASSMGMESQFGSISPGKTADLAVIDGDPLLDFHLIGQPVQALFKEGLLVINRCGLKMSQAD